MVAWSSSMTYTTKRRHPALAELQPWVDQWHAENDPTYGVSLAKFCAELLSERSGQVGMTVAELRAWRPEPARRGRRSR